MALTTEQQAQADIQIAVENVRHANQMAMENVRHANQMATEEKRISFEAVRLAKETLIENSRSLPADSREVTAVAVTAFAASLVDYVNK
jgi:hypothetical protein